VIDTLRLTAEEAAGLLQRGEVSPQELTEAYASAVAARNEELNAYLHVANEVGPGVPIALKDCISTLGVPTTAGSKILEGYVPVFDSTVAARVK
jgi:aspartyl-tRNA(Asn)/glutamyl-tRNA(Gln) amidotransferase subunit A